MEKIDLEALIPEGWLEEHWTEYLSINERITLTVIRVKASQRRWPVPLVRPQDFEDFFKDTYLTYRFYEKDLYVNLVTTNMSKRLQEVLNKNKTLVFMSGTLHSKNVLEKVFGITDYKTVEAETIPPGTIEIHQTGNEFDCRYENFNQGNKTREDLTPAPK